MTPPAPPSPDLRGAAEVFRAFLRLGLTSFGGPIAHLGYFREAFVVRRGWLDEARFAQLLAVCQFLPGPASSQMGFAIGLLRAGWGGALAAFAGFTLPSALLMLAFAGSVSRLERGVGAAALHGLKLVAVVVVAQGVAGMARRMTPDLRRAAIAAAAAGSVLGLGTAWAQLAAIALGAALGALLCRRAPAPADAGFAVPYGHGLAYALLAAALLGLLVALSVPPAPQATPAALAAAFYRAGALVFGGGHVVLPLLEQSLVDPGWLDAGTFLAGYGAAQAMPGPMFTIATFLGAQTPTGLPAPAGAALATLALFLPGFLLLLAALPLWGALVRLPRAAALLAGVNAAVVGLLAAALYDPLWTQGVRDRTDLGIVAVGLALVLGLKRSALWALAWCTAASVATHLLAG
ncbi:chromate transporter [Vulcaniibacterium tengchongense]|uniref:Chromate transporter n=1 Tax=Vulcaniibacterium tengchongense TaxID=1273429 RepID=A0A3N4VFV6_9GAMM|nr:chromate transporter [Vulcaniibacterium tengchongense]RPE81902.1 chromate transporter [Vulcaniibacterium tengchongense]